MRKLFPGTRLLPLLLVAVGVAGCNQTWSSSSPPPAMPMPPAQQAMPPMFQEVDLIDMSHKIADSLVGELRKNHPSFSRQKPILVASFVDRANVDSTSELGLMIADHISSRLTQQGYAVVEPKLREDISIRVAEGEFVLSRDIDKLSAEYRAFAVVVGSYTRSRETLDFTTRMIQVRNKQVLASIDAKMPLGTSSRDLLVETGGPALKAVDR
ncbi:MAG: hypothetical protein HQL66_01180 [Magnetococcales bacterium]|nr:hypothetical protein [Magnetococcales bacterium]